MLHPGQKSTGHSATPGAGEEAHAIVQSAPPPTKVKKESEKKNNKQKEQLMKICVLLTTESITVKGFMAFMIMQIISIQ